MLRLSATLFPAINFAIYLVIVVRFVVPAMRDYLRRGTPTSSRLRPSPSAQLTRAQTIWPPARPAWRSCRRKRTASARI
jgi:hypothetical protein